LGIIHGKDVCRKIFNYFLEPPLAFFGKLCLFFSIRGLECINPDPDPVQTVFLSFETGQEITYNEDSLTVGG